jgi:hypothetical protein
VVQTQILANQIYNKEKLLERIQEIKQSVVEFKPVPKGLLTPNREQRKEHEFTPDQERKRQCT